jgi:amino acid transporter
VESGSQVRTAAEAGAGQLERGIGLGGGVALNMIDMIGVGPFITLPLLVMSMGGPQSMLGWVLGAAIALCDGLVWAELGAAMPRAGGSYAYLSEMYGKEGAGKFFSFLYIWQLGFSAPLSIASGCVGLAMYAGYLDPGLRGAWWSWSLASGHFNFDISFGPGTLVAMGAVTLAVVLLYRKIESIAQFAQWLWVGVALAMGLAICAGLTHFNPHVAFDFPAGAFKVSPSWLNGLGMAMLIATYDYWGYYNICFLGGEVRNPGKNIPRAVVWSILITGGLYLLLNVSLMSVVPWREIAGKSLGGGGIFSVMLAQVWGRWAGVAMAVLVMWTAFASVYALMLGYSRVPYAAAVDGNYFRVFAKLHAKGKFPYVSLLALGAAAMVFCLFSLMDLVAALVVLRIVLQFLLQQAGLIRLRITRPDLPRPFRVWLYPLPVVVAMVGFGYMLFMRPNFERELLFAGVVAVSGCVAYGVRSMFMTQTKG